MKKNNWEKSTIGHFRSNGQTKEITGFNLYIRECSFDAFLKKSSNTNVFQASQTDVNTSFFHRGSNPPMGRPQPILTPSVCGAKLSCDDNMNFCTKRNSYTLPELATFQNYASLLKARPDSPCILIGFDSEWQTHESYREMLSWQFSVIWDEKIIEFCFIKKGGDDLSLSMALGCILDYIQITSIDTRILKRYEYCTGWNNDEAYIIKTDNLQEAKANAIYAYENGMFIHKKIEDMEDKYLKRGERDWSWFHTFDDYSNIKRIPVTLVCHTGKVDISSLSRKKKADDILYLLTEVQGGMVTLNAPITINAKSLKNVNNTSVYPISLRIADTMCHAPAGMKKLEDLGRVVGIKKVDIPAETKAHMKNFLQENLKGFLEYASTDSVVTLLYASAMYSYNNTPPITITSATASVMKNSMMEYLSCSSTEHFNMVYRGLHTVKHGLLPRKDRPFYVESTSLDPINDKVNTIQNYASKAYHGGYNSCSEVGYFPQSTFDYDLQNAYPTAMCLVPDIDWSNPIRNEILNRNLDLKDWSDGKGINPIIPFVGYVRFEFPENVKYPCIPINVDGIPIYPRTSDNIDGVYVAGPYIYLALKLGATVFCERGYFLNSLYNKKFHEESRSLSVAVKQLVLDRNKAKEECGKKSLEELILKTMVNSGYGKIAQNVIQKTTWSAYKDSMEDLGCSPITNPVSAMMITSIVQVELLAAQNQLSKLGYITCSVTTDGFISNCPEDILKNLDLYGIRFYIEESRLFLTGKPDLWEMKHHQNDLINFTTRGNVSLLPHGVCAHNSCKSGFESDSFEDRLWLMEHVLSRTGPVSYSEKEWTTFKDLVKGKPFIIKSIKRAIRMDFDLKRKPDRTSFTTDRPIVNNTEYEIAHFDTNPFENIDEFRLYRRKKELVKVLRTQKDWDEFEKKIVLNGTNTKVRDMEWAILYSCIMGYRAGRWDIPALSGNTTVDEKCEWINKHNTSKKVFKSTDWKNSRRPERQANMLPVHLIQNKLNELISG